MLLLCSALLCDCHCDADDHPNHMDECRFLALAREQRGRE